ncbi:hypothetical protein JCM8208_005505 [Rhodotorula glutinis]
MPSASPSTLLARWPSANPSSAIPVLGRALTTSRPGLSTGRRAVQIRPFRLPASEHNGKEGRGMYVVRHLDGASDRVDVFVEDPGAPGVRATGEDKGKGKGKAEDGGDEVMASSSDGTVAHSRWTHCAVGLPPSTTTTSSSPPAPGGPPTTGAGALFDTFIQRALFAPPAPGGQPSSARDPSAWQPRAQAVSLEGYTFVVGGGAGGGGGGTPGAGAGAADWEVKVSSVGLKGGSASGTTRGCIVEVTYLAVPYLPPGSTLVHDFLLSLFPPAAVKNGEVELVSIAEDVFVDAGLLDPPVNEDDEGRWEWRDKHSTFAYVHQFKKEGLL